MSSSNGSSARVVFDSHQDNGGDADVDFSDAVHDFVFDELADERARIAAHYEVDHQQATLNAELRRLDAISKVLSRGRRDVSALLRIAGQYTLSSEMHEVITEVASATATRVRLASMGS